jgi:prepilin-type N-terminal cleavage/methylation domain-containing protein
MHHSKISAFTLIELLVVIAIIGVLVGLIFVAVKPAKEKQRIAIAQSEQHQVAVAIETYEKECRVFPPDNPDNALINPLFFELAGTTRSANGDFQTLDGSGRILAGEFVGTFGPRVSGFVNSSSNPKSSDDARTAVNFLKDFRPTQSGDLSAGSAIKLLTCSVSWDQKPYPIPAGVPVGMNPWRYVSTHPTNNPNSYDLWVEIPLSGKSKRIGNWGR